MSSLRPSSEFTRASVQFAVSGVAGVADFRFNLSPIKPANVLLGPSGSGKTLVLSLIAAGLQGCLPERGALFEDWELTVNGAPGLPDDGSVRCGNHDDCSSTSTPQRECSVEIGVRKADSTVPDVPIRRVCYLSPFADPGGLWPISDGAARRGERVRHALDRFPFRHRLQRLEAEIAAFDTEFSAFETILEGSPELLVRCPNAVADALAGVRSLLSDVSLPYLGSTAERLEAQWVRARVACLENRTAGAGMGGTECAKALEVLQRRARLLETVVADPGHMDAERSQGALNRLLRTMDCRFALETAGDGTVELVDDNGDRVSMETVSSGVAQALDLWTVVALAPPGTLLLLDDPETGMDVRWRGAFLPFLLKTLSERACWAIVATQCPAIVHNRIDLVVESAGGR